MAKSVVLRRYRRVLPKNTKIGDVVKSRVIAGSSRWTDAGLKHMIDSRIKKAAETKWNHQNAQEAVGFNSSIGNILVPGQDVYNAMPSILRGDDSYQRIGEKITPLYGYVDFQLGFNPAYTTPWDINVHVFMLRCKSVKAARNINSVPILNLLEYPGGSVNFDGTAVRGFLPVDKSDFSVIHHKKVRLVQNTGAVQSESHSGRTFRLKYKCPKLQWDESLDAAYPSNDLVVYCVGWTSTNPGQNFDITIRPLLVTTSVGMYYKDQ